MLVHDANGKPFVVVKEQEKATRSRGVQALKENVAVALQVCHTLKTSLGPRGMDKILTDADNSVTVTNDGATILEHYPVKHPVATILVELAKSQDAEIGDGTTGVVVLAGGLLESALQLLERGIHPTRIAAGYERACKLCCSHLEAIAENKDTKNLREVLLQTAATTLSSKVITVNKSLFAKMCVDAVCAVADFPRKDVNLDLIKIVGKPGGLLSDSCLVPGVVLEKEMSHAQMPKILHNAKVAVLTCPFEPPKSKDKTEIVIKDAAGYKDLADYEQRVFREMVRKVKSVGADIVMCQWGFDDEANHLLVQEQLPAVRWVGGVELEQVAIATNAKIVPRFEDLTAEKLGKAKVVKEVGFGANKDKLIFVESMQEGGVCTMFIRGGNAMLIEEAKRSVHDAICVCRNLVRDSRIVYGGGSCEISCSLMLTNIADKETGMDQYAFRAFADALDVVPNALAENSGLAPIKYLAKIKNKQVKTGNHHLGIDCLGKKEKDMKVQGVYETLAGKQQQFRLATQVVKMILKIDDVMDTRDAQ